MAHRQQQRRRAVHVARLEAGVEQFQRVAARREEPRPMRRVRLARAAGDDAAPIGRAELSHQRRHVHEKRGARALAATAATAGGIGLGAVVGRLSSSRVALCCLDERLVK